MKLRSVIKKELLLCNEAGLNNSEWTEIEYDKAINTVLERIYQKREDNGDTETTTG